jgi:hypothetical protein
MIDSAHFSDQQVYCYLYNKCKLLHKVRVLKRFRLPACQILLHGGPMMNANEWESGGMVACTSGWSVGWEFSWISDVVAARWSGGFPTWLSCVGGWVPGWLSGDFLAECLVGRLVAHELSYHRVWYHRAEGVPRGCWEWWKWLNCHCY